MNGNKVFVDTNILIYFLQGEQDVIDMISDKDLAISFITELELLSFPRIEDETEDLINQFLKECTIIDINRKIKDLTIGIRRKSKLMMPDSIVAATAYFMNLPLLTADKQFERLEEIDVVIYAP
ncbi:MAG TPA: VapC toxin family PIN domain ribonuclease [Cytophagales bacterium]|jgi:predicted nucleic acid-binding protein|nr:VapC toxin family PIN domain ribonuclease [Cytophagales bacterium]